MAAQRWSGEASRKIVERVVVEGDLVLQTPAHFGNGDSTDLTDMPLLTDAADGKAPLLTGATLAGALRSYLRERELGIGKSEAVEDAEAGKHASASVLLFGGKKQDPDGEQSPLLIEDARGKNYGVEMREGVGIDGKSRTAAEGKLYDAQVWQAGTRFRTRFELVMRQGEEERLKRALALALEGLQNGAVRFGMRKARGLGSVSVDTWHAQSYVLRQENGEPNVPAILKWLREGNSELKIDNEKKAQDAGEKDIWKALGIAKGDERDARHTFRINAHFSLDGSLLIRSQSGKDDTGPDMGYLRARQPSNEVKAILSGTSLGGALRARALKICNTLAGEKNKGAGKRFVDELFGTDMEELRRRQKERNASGESKTDAQGRQEELKPKASRIRVSEQVVEHAVTNLVQNRVSIDRFTGGARDTALFNEQPAFGGDGTKIEMDLEIRKPSDAEIGLLLLLLKDLWTGDLPLGGESSVGRGRLHGTDATLTEKNGALPVIWKIERVKNETAHDEETRVEQLLIPENAQRLEDYVIALKNALRKGAR